MAANNAKPTFCEGDAGSSATPLTQLSKTASIGWTDGVLSALDPVEFPSFRRLIMFAPESKETPDDCSLIKQSTGKNLYAYPSK